VDGSKLKNCLMSEDGFVCEDCTGRIHDACGAIGLSPCANASHSPVFWRHKTQAWDACQLPIIPVHHMTILLSHNGTLTVTQPRRTEPTLIPTHRHPNRPPGPQTTIVTSKITHVISLLHYVRFEVFTAVTIFWDVTPCGSCKNRRFGGT
jgi:hypothetical protein